MYLVYGLSLNRIIFGIWYTVYLKTEKYLVFSILFFLAPQIVFGYSNTGLNIFPNSFTNFLNKMSCMRQICLSYLPFSKILYTIQYLVFGIQIVGPNSTIRIQYSDFLDTL